MGIAPTLRLVAAMLGYPLVAAPGYVAAKGEPASVQELRQHNCIGFRLVSTGGVYSWDLHEAGKDVTIEVNGTTLVTDPTYARDLALAGVGIAYIFEPLVRAELREKRLTWLLPDAAIMEPGLFIYFPQRSARMPKLRAFLDVAREVD